jgi:hypothetical protein
MLEIHVKKLKMLSVAIGSLVLVGLGVVLPTLHPSKTTGESIWLIALAAVDIAFFGICFLFSTRQLLRADAAIRIDDRGIEDYSSMLSPGFVPWSELVSWHFVQFGFQEFICFIPRDPSAFLKSQPRFRRFFMRLNLGLVNSPFCISADSIRISLPEMAVALGRNLPMSARGARQSLNS